jgi:hypothetical protein
MCSECISQELNNIKNMFPAGEKKIVIIGVFEKKRHYVSTVNSISNSCVPIYVNIGDCTVKNLPKTPFYCHFNVRDKVISNVFYPQPCDTDRTCDYLRKMK